MKFGKTTVPNPSDPVDELISRRSKDPVSEGVSDGGTPSQKGREEHQERQGRGGCSDVPQNKNDVACQWLQARGPQHPCWELSQQAIQGSDGGRGKSVETVAASVETVAVIFDGLMYPLQSLLWQKCSARIA